MNNNIRTGSWPRPLRPFRRAFLAGFLISTLGFLTASGLFPRGGAAQAATPLEDALSCQARLRESETGRDRLLRQADSLGAQIVQVRQSGKKAPEALLRQAARIQGEAMDRELDLLAQRERCRTLSEEALSFCSRRIAELQALLEGGRGDAGVSAELLRLQEERARLEGTLSGPAVFGYPLLPHDSSDTQETLKAKLQYYVDVHGYLAALDRRVSSRRGQVVEERRSLLEAQRFLQELALVDEGGRVSSGGSVLLRGGTGGSGLPDGAAGRQTGASAALPNRAGDLEFVLGLAPATPEESDHLIRLLDGFRQEIQRELDAVARERERIASRILPETAAPR